VNSRKKEKPYTSQLKGVATLLGELPQSTGSVLIAIDHLVPSKTQPRNYFDPDKQQQLVESVKRHGILEPLLVRPLTDSKHEIVAGERRYRAALEAELTQVPVVIKELNDEQALQLALIENLQRVDLNPVEETEGILTLLSIHLQQEVEEVVRLLYRMQNELKGKVTQNVLGNPLGEKIVEVFQSLGTMAWESFVTSRLPLLKLPSELLQALKEGKIAYTKAQAIAKVKNEQQRKSLLDEAIEKELSLTQIRERIHIFTSDEREPNIPQQTLSLSYRRLKAAKLWENPKKWQKVQNLLKRLEALIEEEN
jgi:ParB family chromosome partitioning protein